MVSFTIHSTGNATTCITKLQVCKDHHRSSNHVYVSISNSRWPHKVSASSIDSATTSVTSLSSSSSLCDYNNLIHFDNILNEELKNNDIESSRFSEKLDEWMRDSLGDIVKNLNQAPLLVQIYANNDDGSKVIKTERAVEANWSNVMRKKPLPDGIILVEELGDEEGGNENKVWGVLIQGKGKEREWGSACYLLKTCRVGGGLGLFSTHFCLIKVKNFRDSAIQQFTDSWLVQ